MKVRRSLLHVLFLLLVLQASPLLAQPERAALYRDSIRHSNDLVKLMEYHALLGESVYLSDPDSALYFFLLGDSIAQLVPEAERTDRYYESYSPLLNNTAFVSQKRGDIVLAVQLYERCIAIQNKIGDLALLGGTYLNLGKLYSEAGEEDLAFLNFGLAKQNLLDGDLIGQAHCQNGLGHVLFVQGKYEAALNCYYSALNLFQRADHKEGQTRTNINIGQLYFKQKQLAPALECFRISLQFAILTQNLQGQAESYYYLGEIAFRNNQIDSAKYFGEKSLGISKELGYPRNLRDASSLLFRIYQSEGNANKALEMHILLSEMNDSLNNVDKNNAIIKEKLREEYESKTTELKAEQEKKTAIAAEEAKHQRVVNYITLAALVLVLGFLAVAWRSYRAKKKAHDIITEQKIIVDEKNRNITDSIRYASHLQTALMPQEQIVNEQARSTFIFFQPKDIVSGDFFWSITVNNSLYVAICDSTGHGVPGAFVSLLNMSFIKEAINEKQITSPAAILDFVRDRLVNSFQQEQSQDGMDAIIFRIDLSDMSKSTYAAANNAPIIVRNGAVIELRGDKMSVGKSLFATQAFAEFSLSLMKGDTLVAYTDGFADQFGGPNGKKYKYKNLNQFLVNAIAKDPTAIKVSLENEFNTWKGDLEQTDDVLVYGIQF